VFKHSQAARAEVTAAVDDRTLSVEIGDDGVGGADPEGHRLLGVGDRVAALGGRLRLDSRSGEGTVLAAVLPLPSSSPG
jgi:signal transduction histidine kinase